MLTTDISDMNKVIVLVISLFSAFNCHNEAKEVETKFHDVMDKLQRLDHFEYLVHLKICDESTLDGELSLSNEQASTIMECAKLDDDQVCLSCLHFLYIYIYTTIISKPDLE